MDCHIFSIHYQTKKYWCGYLFSSKGLRAFSFFEKSAHVVMNKLQLYTKEAIRCITRDVLQVKKVLISYLKTGRVQYSFGLVYQPQTLFARKVLACVKRIPAGKTVSYAWIAGSIGFPKAARAVGTVLAKNQLPLFIPCHRVVKKNKKIGNFSAGDGFKLKEKLVDLEKTRRACSV